MRALTGHPVVECLHPCSRRMSSPSMAPLHLSLFRYKGKQTLISRSLAMNWMLNGPVTLRAFAISLVAWTILLTVSSSRSCGGSCERRATSDDQRATRSATREEGVGSGTKFITRPQPRQAKYSSLAGPPQRPTRAPTYPTYDEGGVARVHAGVLDVLADHMHHELALDSDGIHLDFLGLGDELGDDDRVLCPTAADHVLQHRQAPKTLHPRRVGIQHTNQARRPRLG